MAGSRGVEGPPPIEGEVAAWPDCALEHLTAAGVLRAAANAAAVVCDACAGDHIEEAGVRALAEERAAQAQEKAP
jgi:hypothetical protein